MSAVVVGLSAVVVAVTAEEPRVLLVQQKGGVAALPQGRLEPERDRTLELALRERVAAETGYGLGYVEQLYTFGNRHRDPEERGGGPRTLSIAYLALVRESAATPAPGAVWVDWYDCFPWEEVIDEGNMLISKSATIHRRQDPHEMIRITVPAPGSRVPGY